MNLKSIMLLVTDVDALTSTLWILSDNDRTTEMAIKALSETEPVQEAYRRFTGRAPPANRMKILSPRKVGDFSIINLPGVVSRKAQIAPAAVAYKRLLEKLLPPAVVAGSYNAFHVRDDFRQMIDRLPAGGEVHIVTCGGGGDVMGGLLAAREWRRIFKNQGKNIKVKVFTSNLKRGMENPVGGPTPVETIRISEEEGLRPIKGTRHFYSLKKGIKAFAPISDEAGRTIYIEGHPITSPVELSEGKIVDLVAKEWDIEIIMADASRSGEELGRDYQGLTRGKAVLTVGLDMGGDILARFPEPVVEGKFHPERNIRSPNTDAVFLDMLYYLEKEKQGDVILGISALGGDGELGRTLTTYLTQMYENNEISGILDNVSFFSHQSDIPQEVISLPIETEVSYNFVDRILKWMKTKPLFITSQVWDKKLAREIPRYQKRRLRKGTRQEILPRLYPYTVFVKPSVVREKIAEKVPEGLNWYEMDAFLREQFNYQTEMTDPNNCLLYTSPSPRDLSTSRMPSSA